MPDTPTQPPASRGILFAAATSPECRAVAASGAQVVQSGIGGTNAVRAIGETLRKTRRTGNRITGIVSIGTAAGLLPGLETGAVILPTEIRMAEMRRFTPSPDWRRIAERALNPLMPVHAGALTQTNVLLATAAEKSLRRRQTQADAADMESASLAEFAENHGLQFLAVRVILDNADDALPASAAVAVDASGDLTPGRLLASLARRPGDIGSLWRIARGFRKAHRTLGDVCRIIVPVLEAVALPFDMMSARSAPPVPTPSDREDH